MLIEIFCNKFKQRKITFKDGLNVILGDDNATNSIGKSTFLLVIDFVFGGNTYQNTSDIINHVGKHSICFCFKFETEKYYFKRDTAEAASVHICNDRYEIVRTISTEEFRDFLKDAYRIEIKDLSWRQFVGLYMRIYGKPNLNETAPLYYGGSNQQAKEVQTLLKTFDRFDECAVQYKIKEETANRYSAFQKAQSYKIIEPIKSKSEFKQLEKDLTALQSQRDDLRAVIETYSADLTSEQLQVVADLKSKLSDIQMFKAKRQIRLRKLKNDISHINNSFDLDYSNILRFFPNVNLREIDKINEFHRQLTKILSSDIREEIDNETKWISEYEETERKIIVNIQNFIKISEPQKLSLDRFVQLQNEINNLIKGKDTYNLRNRFKEEKDTAARIYENILQDSLTEVQQELNNEINKRNDIIFNGTVKSPMITLRPKSYKYSCIDDNGTGSNYKNLILFDLSVLTLTSLPTMIHDTILFKNIAVDVLEKIIYQYSQFKNKQIFISFDNLSNYSQEAKEILVSNRILSLAPNGNELFGFSWNKKTE